MEMSKLSSPPQNPDEDTCHIALMSEHTNGQQHSDQQQNPSSSLIPKFKRWFLSIVAVIVFWILVGVGIYFGNATHDGTNYFKEYDMVDCIGDNFIGSNITDNLASSKNVFIKFYIGKEKNESVSFEMAQGICKRLNSTLWEVNSKDEWETITNRSKSVDDRWLGGKFNGKCELRKKPCLEEANSGKGYLVFWNSTGHSSDYSRLCKCDFTSEDNDQCLYIYIERNGNLLWGASNCKIEEKYFICIKRNCKVEH